MIKYIILFMLICQIGLACEWEKELIKWVDETNYGSIRKIMIKKDTIYLREWAGAAGLEGFEPPYISFPIKDWSIIKKHIEDLIKINEKK